MKTEQANKSVNSSERLGVFVIVLVIGWVLLRVFAQSGVDSYNKCYMQAASNTDAARSATIAAGYSASDATKASFDTYTDQVSNCSKQRPPDWVILITGVTAKDSN